MSTQRVFRTEADAVVASVTDTDGLTDCVALSRLLEEEKLDAADPTSRFRAAFIRESGSLWKSAGQVAAERQDAAHPGETPREHFLRTVKNLWKEGLR